MEDSIFTKIIKGEIPSYKIYEDNKTIAFLDIHPKHGGHTLVVPKNQVEFVWDLTDEDYRELMEVCHKVARRIKDVLNTKYVGMQVIGVDVPHAHVHIIPFDNVEEFHFIPDKDLSPDIPSLIAMAKKLRFEVQ